MKNAFIPLAAALLAASFAGTAQGTEKISLLERKAPDVSSLPSGPYRDLVVLGQQLSTRAFAHIGPEVKDPAKRFAGNNLACTSCHQAEAAKPFAMPWVGVAAVFPQYRAREDDISTVEKRVNGCMQRSMNGRALPLESREMKAFVAYISFLSQGVPGGAALEGAAPSRPGFPTGVPIPKPAASCMPPSAPRATAPKDRACAPDVPATRRVTPSRRCGARTASTREQG